LIDKFSIQKKPPKDAPQIAISVDMLDTGIDIPDVVNLVFFKPIRSKTKFWQMIGRGTRLCPDLFGLGKSKEHFFVFDYCGNFEFFNENPEGVEGNTQESINTRLFRTRLDILKVVDKQEGSTSASRIKDGEKSFRDIIIDHLHGEVTAMNVDNFIVRPKRKLVEAFQSRTSWGDLSIEDYGDLHNEIALLPSQQEPEHPSAKFFDLLMLRIQLGILESDPSTSALIRKVKEIASDLEELERIPAVKEQITLIQAMQTDDYWEDITAPLVERARVKIRDLVKHIENRGQQTVITDFEDEIGQGTEVVMPRVSAAINKAEYKKKFKAFLQAHESHISLQKVKMNEPLTKSDIEQLEKMLFESGDLGTKEEFEASFGAQERLGVFIRKLVGLDREAAKRAFDQYLGSKSLNSKQIEFISTIVDYLTQNGVMDPKMLFEHPFTNLSPTGPTSLFEEEEASQLVKIIRSFEANALAA
jgi:type I restriction enzyme R subunit